MYLWGNGLNAEVLCEGGGEPGDRDRLCRLDKGTGGLGAWPKAPSGGNRSLVKIGGGGSKSSNVKSGDTVGSGMSNSSSSKSLDESMLSITKILNIINYDYILFLYLIKKLGMEVVVHIRDCV